MYPEVLKHVHRPGLNSTFFPKRNGYDMMLETRREGEREENLADPQSSLVTLWTRCSFYRYSMVQFDLSAVFSSFFPLTLKESVLFSLIRVNEEDKNDTFSRYYRRHKGMLDWWSHSVYSQITEWFFLLCVSIKVQGNVLFLKQTFYRFWGWRNWRVDIIH